MKKFGVLFVLAVMLIVIPVTNGLAQARDWSRDNPLLRHTINLWPLIERFRVMTQTTLIRAVEEPITMRDGIFLHLCAYAGTQALGNLYEWEQRQGGVRTLEELTSISYFGSPKAVFRVMMFYQFPDELKFADAGFFEIEKPTWWEALSGR